MGFVYCKLKEIMDKTTGIIILITLIIGCGNNNQVCEYTSEDTCYFENGNIKSIEKFNIHNHSYSVYTEYYNNGKLKYIGGSIDTNWIGPIEYYDTNGLLSLYNEIDLIGKTFYVKKYDKGVLIKEEGLAISNCIFDIQSFYGKEKWFMIVYAEPKGYKNKIVFWLDSKEINFINVSDHHVGLIKLDTVYQNGINHNIKVHSELFDDKEKLIDSNTIYKNFFW